MTIPRQSNIQPVQEPRWKLIALDIAELIDAYRIVPRGIMGGYGYLVYALTVWFFGLDEPNAAQAAFASIVWGAAGGLTGWYFNTGRKWGPEASHYRYMRTGNMETFSGPDLPPPDSGNGYLRQQHPYRQPRYDYYGGGVDMTRYPSHGQRHQYQPQQELFDSEMDGSGEGTPKFNPDDLDAKKSR